MLTPLGIYNSLLLTIVELAYSEYYFITVYYNHYEYLEIRPV